MDDFDRYLDLELRQMLDHLVEARAPRRGRRNRRGRPLLTALFPTEASTHAFPALEFVAVPVMPRLVQ